MCRSRAMIIPRRLAFAGRLSYPALLAGMMSRAQAVHDIAFGNRVPAGGGIQFIRQGTAGVLLGPPATAYIEQLIEGIPADGARPERIQGKQHHHIQPARYRRPFIHSKGIHGNYRQRHGNQRGTQHNTDNAIQPTQVFYDMKSFCLFVDHDVTSVEVTHSKLASIGIAEDRRFDAWKIPLQITPRIDINQSYIPQIHLHKIVDPDSNSRR
jgi:hypothetical protein